MRKVIAAVPVAMVAGYLALSGSEGPKTHSHAGAAPDAPAAIAMAVGQPAGVARISEQAHATAQTARAAATLAAVRAGSAQVAVAADAQAAVSVSLDGLLEILVQELERSADDGSVVELRQIEISVGALADLAAELEGMADIQIGDSGVAIVGSPDGARVRVRLSSGEPAQ